jgi:hypothetical protein
VQARERWEVSGRNVRCVLPVSSLDHRECWMREVHAGYKGVRRGERAVLKCSRHKEGSGPGWRQER